MGEMGCFGGLERRGRLTPEAKASYHEVLGEAKAKALVYLETKNSRDAGIGASDFIRWLSRYVTG